MHLSIALDALTRESDPGPAWALAAGALFLAGLARAESWLLLPLAAGYGLLAWRRGERRAAVLALPLAAPLLWLAHDWLLTGDPLFAVRVPGRSSWNTPTNLRRRLGSPIASPR